MGWVAYTKQLRSLVGMILFISAAFAAADLTAVTLEGKLKVPPQPIPSPARLTAEPRKPAWGNITFLLKQSSDDKNTTSFDNPDGTDPTHPRGASSSPKPKPSPPPELHLKGTIKGRGITLALIETNGKLAAFKAGDRIDGYTIAQVYPQQITLTKNNHTITVQMSLQSTSSPVNQKNRSHTKSHPVVPGRRANPNPQQGKLSLKELRSMLDNPSSYQGKFRLTGVQRKGEPVGMLIQFSSPDNPLAKLGLRHGDIVKALNGKPLRTPDDLSRAYRTLRNSTSLTFTVERGGRTIPVRVQLED